MKKVVKVRKKKSAAQPGPSGVAERLSRVERAVLGLGDAVRMLSRNTLALSRDVTDRAKADARRAEMEARRAEMEARRDEIEARRAKEETQRAKEEARRAEKSAKQSEADRDRFARLEEELAKDRRNNENHRRNSSRALENAFAASLPRVMKSAYGIKIDPRDVKVRVRRGRKRREYDFVAPNSEVVLVGEVKTRFTLEDLDQLIKALFHFRRDYPEYAGLKMHGVVAGGVVEDDALEQALDNGFIVLQMDGAEAHPATEQGYAPAVY